MPDPQPLTGTVITTPRIGRPSSYKPEYCDMILDYFESIASDREPERLIRSEGDKNTQYQLAPKPLPTLIGFARTIGVSRKVLGEWAERHEAFREARARAMEIGEELLTQDSYRGLVAPIIATWLGSNYTSGLRDRKEVVTEITVTQASPALSALPDDKLQQIQVWLAETEKKQVESGE